MSASNTTLKKQKRRHKGPLIGIAIALGVAGILFLVYLLVLADPEVEDPAADLTTEEPAEVTPGVDETAD